MYDDLPESLKGMKDYLVKAEQFKNIDPVVSVYCKVYALEKGVKERDNTDKAVMPLIMRLMEQSEAEKKQLGIVDDAQTQVDDDRVYLLPLPTAPLCAAARIPQINPSSSGVPYGAPEYVGLKHRGPVLCAAGRTHGRKGVRQGRQPVPRGQGRHEHCQISTSCCHALRGVHSVLPGRRATL